MESLCKQGQGFTLLSSLLAAPDVTEQDIDVSTKLSNGSPIQALTVNLRRKARPLTHVTVKASSYSEAVLMIYIVQLVTK